MDDKYYLGVPVKGTKDREALRDAALRKAVELAPFSAPEEAVEEEHKMLLAEFRHRLTYDSMATGKPLYAYEGLEEQMEGLKDEAVFQVKSRLVLADVIRRQGLAISQEELEAEGEAIAQRQNVSLAEVRSFLGADLSMVRSDLLERKAMDFICDHAALS